MMIMSQQSCKCGKHMAGTSVDCIIPEEVIAAIYCPDESRGVKFNKETMVEDNGWIIEYDMEIARYYAEHARIDPTRITPEYLFIEGLASWTGMTPTDQIDLPKRETRLSSSGIKTPSVTWKSSGSGQSPALNDLRKKVGRRLSKRSLSSAHIVDKISVKGAREHNLKSISVELPRNKITVITGPSGSGKSSLAFDTIYAEGQRRYVESLSAYARQFLELMEKPDVDYIEGLSPAISIEQKSISKNPRSTVGRDRDLRLPETSLCTDRPRLLL